MASGECQSRDPGDWVREDLPHLVRFAVPCAPAEPTVASGPDPGEIDGALVEAAQADVRAFAAIWERHFDAVYRYCLSELRNVEDAEDVAAETFEKALKALPKLNLKPGKFKPWLFTIAHNQTRSHQRKQRFRIAIPLPMFLRDARADASPEQAAVMRSELERSLDLFSHLPRDQRRVAILAATGFSCDEIAQILGKGTVAVRQSQSRATRTLRSLAEKEERHGV